MPSLKVPNLTIPDLQIPDETQAAAPQQTAGLTVPDLKVPELTIPKEEAAEDDWATVIGKSIAQMPARLKNSWNGIINTINTAQTYSRDEAATDANALATAARNGDAAAIEKIKAYGVNPADLSGEYDTEGADVRRQAQAMGRGMVGVGEDNSARSKAEHKLSGAMQMEKLNADPEYVKARDESLRVAGELAATAPKTGDQWSAKNLVSTMLSAGADMAPSIGLSLITKRPMIGLAEMTGQAYGQYMEEGLSKGLAPDEARKRAGILAAMEGISEKTPLNLILHGGGKGLTDLGKSALAEGAQEGFVQAVQEAYDNGYLKEGATLGEMANNILFSSVVGSGTGAGIHGTLHAPAMVKNAMDARSQRNLEGAAEAGRQGGAATAVPEGEYDAVAAEMGATEQGDALDQMVKPQTAPQTKAAYTAAREQGMSPAEAMEAARAATADLGDSLDAMVQEALAPKFDSPDSVYYANKAGVTNPPQSVAEMVQQQAAQGDLGQLPSEQRLLSPVGQTSTIAMEGAPEQVLQPTRPTFSPTGTVDEMSASRSPMQQLPAEPVIAPEPKPLVIPDTLALPAPNQTSTIAMGGYTKPVGISEPIRPRYNPQGQADESAPRVRSPLVVPELKLPPLPPNATRVDTAPVDAQVAAPEAAKPKRVPRYQAQIDAVPEAVPEVSAEDKAAIEQRNADYVAKNQAPMLSTDGKPKMNPVAKTENIIKQARERGVTEGAKVNWKGKEYDVDRVQGRAVRLLDENGNADIADIQEVNAPQQAAQEQQGVLSSMPDAFQGTPEVKQSRIEGIAKAKDLVAQGGKVVERDGVRGVETSDGSFTPSNELGFSVMSRIGQANRKAQPVESEKVEFPPEPIKERVLSEGKGAAMNRPNKMLNGRTVADWLGDKLQSNSRDGVPDARQFRVEERHGKHYAMGSTQGAGMKQVPKAVYDLYKKVTSEAPAKPAETDSTEWKADAERMGYEPLNESDPLFNKYTRDFSGNPVRIVASNGQQLMDEKGNRHMRATTAKKAFDKPAEAVAPTSEKPTERDEIIARRKRDNPLYPKKAPSLKTDSKPKGMEPTEVAKVVADFMRQHTGTQAVHATVVPSQNDLGFDVPEGKMLMGFYDMGNIKASFVADNFANKAELEATLRHEFIVHYGLRSRLSRTAYDVEMDRILAAEGKSKQLDALFKEARESYDNFYDISTPDGQRMIAEEVMAMVAERPDVLEKTPLFRRVLEAIRKLMVKAKLLPDSASMQSVIDLVKANSDFLKNNQVDRADVRVSAPPMGYEAPQDMAPAMKKPNDIDKADVPDSLKAGMRDTMARDERSFYEKVKDAVAAKVSWDGFYQGLFDDLAPIARYEKEQTGGELRIGKDSAYKRAMNTKNVHGVVATAMNKGGVVYQDGVVSVDESVKPFAEIFKTIAEMKGNMLPVWEYWAAAVRANRLLAEGRENLFTQAQIDDIIDYVNKRPDLRKAFNQAHKEWRALNKSVMDFGEATGIIDPDVRKLYESDDYVPFYRVDEEAQKVTAPKGAPSLANQSSGIRRLKGGEGKIDVLANMARNVSHIIQSGYKNAAMQQVRDVTVGKGIVEAPMEFKPVGISNDEMRKALEDMGVSTSRMTNAEKAGYTKLFTQAAPKGNDIITVMEDGKPKYYQVIDPQLMTAIGGMGANQVHWSIDVLGIPKKILTRAVTSVPTFIATNMVRDISGNFVQMSKATGRNNVPTIIKDILTLRPFYKAMQGAYRSMTAHPLTTEYAVNGGMTGGYDTSRPESVAKALRQMEKHGKIISSPAQLWGAYEKMLTASEQATRLSVYQDVMDKTGDPVEAAYQANDVMNFSRRGSSILAKAFMGTVPFLNARLQGLDRLVRGAKENPAAFLLKGAIITASSLALLGMNADDDRYWSLPEYARDNFWIIPVANSYIYIPKPFEIGSVFGTIPERMTEALFRDEHVFWDRMKFMMQNTFAVDMPQFMKPMVEDWINHDNFTDRPIVPMALQRVGAPQQFTSKTPEWIKSFSKSLPEFAPDWMRSPVRLQHMIEGYTGSVGKYVVGVVDSGYSAAATDKVAPAPRDYDYPVVRSFVRPQEGQSSKYVDRLYDMAEKAGKTYGTLKAYKDQEDFKEYRKFARENKTMLSARAGLDKYVGQMQRLNKQTKAVYANDRMTPEAKREALDKLTTQKNAMAKEANDKYWRLF